MSVPVSDLHAMLARVGREFHARRLNRIINHPDVFPWVRGYSTAPLDLSPIVADTRNVLLTGEHGALLFHMLQPGLYEVHSQCLRTGRGKWMLGFTRACLHWMFSRTDAMEIMTRCPHGNRPALALAKAIGGVFEFTNPRGWIKDNDPVPADIYALRIQDWMRTAPGLAERGHWFHERLAAEFARHGKTEPPHDDDATHDRFVGAACEMMLGGQPQKAVILYNRWAALADYAQIRIASFDPLTINIANAFVIVGNDDFWVPAMIDMAA